MNTRLERLKTVLEAQASEAPQTRAKTLKTQGSQRVPLEKTHPKEPTMKDIPRSVSTRKPAIEPSRTATVRESTRRRTSREFLESPVPASTEAALTKGLFTTPAKSVSKSTVKPTGEKTVTVVMYSKPKEASTRMQSSISGATIPASVATRPATETPRSRRLNMSEDQRQVHLKMIHEKVHQIMQNVCENPRKYNNNEDARQILDMAAEYSGIKANVPAYNLFNQVDLKKKCEAVLTQWDFKNLPK